jgi:hypothetical protein
MIVPLHLTRSLALCSRFQNEIRQEWKYCMDIFCLKLGVGVNYVKEEELAILQYNALNVPDNKVSVSQPKR